MKIFNLKFIPDPEKFSLFRNIALTRATRIDGPFRVETSEGLLECQDGWLCLDARGYPYPVSDDEFQMIYEKYEPIDFPITGERNE